MLKKNFQIKNIKGREILDSRGEPTVEVELETDFGIFRASVASGVSKGKYEAVELRDGGERYKGKGVLKAVRNVNEIIAPKLKGEDFNNQKKIDATLISLDGTENKANLGANAILPVSLASCRAAAVTKNIPLWQYIRAISGSEVSSYKFQVSRPCFNVINGGVHAGNDLDLQEFMIIPNTKNSHTPEYESQGGFRESLRLASEIYHTLLEILKEKYGKNSINVGDEGGFAPPISQAKEALGLIEKAVKQQNDSGKIKIALDCAANEFLHKTRDNENSSHYESGPCYELEGKERSPEELLEYYQGLVEKYPIIFIEDPFAEDDFEGWNKIMTNDKIQMFTPHRNEVSGAGSNVLVVGDDLLATNVERMKIAKQKNLCNAMILKLNQIGTVTEALEAAKLAKDFGWRIIVSHRSGETGDDFISDLAVGISADFIKAGAPARGERVAKYNRLLRIEQEI